MLRDSYNHYILGIADDVCDSSITLIHGQKIISIAQEQFYSRKKNDKNFANLAIKNILINAKLTLEDIDYIVYFDSSSNRFKSILKTILTNNFKGFGDFIFHDFLQLTSIFFHKKNLIKKLLKVDKEILQLRKVKKSINSKELSRKILWTNANQASCAGCFFSSKLKESAILYFDDLPNNPSLTLGLGKGNNIKLMREINFEDSLIFFKNSILDFFDEIDFTNNHQVSNKSNHQDKSFAEFSRILKQVVDIKEDGSFALDSQYLRISQGRFFINEKLVNLLAPITTKFCEKTKLLEEFNKAFDEFILVILQKILRHLRKITKSKNLIINQCELINSNMFNKLKKLSIFEEIILVKYPSGVLQSMGCAFFVYHQYLNQSRKLFLENLSLSFSLPNFSDLKIKENLSILRAKYLHFNQELQINNLISQNLFQDKVIAWHQGYLELNNNIFNSPIVIFSGKVNDNNFIKIKNFFERNYPNSQSLGIVCYRKNYLDFFTGSFQEILKEFKSNEIANNLLDNAKKSLNSSIAFVESRAFEENLVFYKILENYQRLSENNFVFILPFIADNQFLCCDIFESYRVFKNNHIDILLLKDFTLFKDDQDCD